MTGGEAMEKKLMLAPSMGCCDLYDFGHQVKFIDEHADFLHIDIKDGNYVKTGNAGGTGKYLQIHKVGETPYTFFLLKQAYDENIVVQQAYDETVTKGYKCTCGSVK